MKKTILAIAIPALFAASANAAVVYDQDGVQVKIFGDADVQFYKSKDKSEEDHNVIRIDDADFGFGLTYDIGGDAKVGGKVNFSAEGGTAELDEAFVGVMGNFGTITFGKQYTILDDAGIGDDYEFGFTGVISELDLYAEQVIKYKYDSDSFYGGIAYQLNADSDDATDANNDYDAIDLNLGFRVADFDAVVYYGNGGDDVIDTEMYLLELRYAFGDFGVAGTYGASEVNDLDSNIYGLTGTWAIDKTTLAAGWANTDVDNAEDINDFYINAAYAFTANVNAYAEIGFSDADEKETGYVIGMQVEF